MTSFLFDPHWNENEPPPSAQPQFEESEGEEDEDEPSLPNPWHRQDEYENDSDDDDDDDDDVVEMCDIDHVAEQSESETETDTRAEDVLTDNRDQHRDDESRCASPTNIINPCCPDRSLVNPTLTRVKLEETNPEPPRSQSHFSTFANFIPNNSAGFDDEFSRLASSQQWVPGSQEYTRQRTIAVRREIETLYFSQPIKEEPPDEEDELEEISPAEFYSKIGSSPNETSCDQKPHAARAAPQQKAVFADFTPGQIELSGYQALCKEVGIEPGVDVAECIRRLKGTLVNIIDLIDTRRTGKPVERWSWDNFEEFRKYTLEPEHRISLKDAKGTVLAPLLQKLRVPGDKKGKRSKRRPKRAVGSCGGLGRVVSGRVEKPRWTK